MTYPTRRGPYDDPHPSPYAEPARPPVAATLPGGLLHLGADVEITVYPGGVTGSAPGQRLAQIQIRGTITDTDVLPAPYITVTDPDGGLTIVFLGPGVIIRPAPPAHPALG